MVRGCWDRLCWVQVSGERAVGTCGGVCGAEGYVEMVMVSFTLARGVKQWKGR